MQEKRPAPSPQATRPNGPQRSAHGQAPKTTDRRGFVTTLAAALGAVAALVPLAAGVVTFVSPLVRKKKARAADMVTVATIDSIPEDGRPVAFPVIAERQDAWSSYPPAKIGTVYVRRIAERDGIQVFTATCPHLGCMVEFQSERNHFLCPCHNSYFEANGARINPESCPSPRDLDALEHQLDGDQILVRFEQFRAGIPEKSPQ